MPKDRADLKRIDARHFTDTTPIRTRDDMLDASAVVCGPLAVTVAPTASYWGGPVSVPSVAEAQYFCVTHVPSGFRIDSYRLPPLTANQAWRVLKATLPLFDWTLTGPEIEQRLRPVWREVIEPAQLAAIE